MNINQIIKQHTLWLDTNGKEGSRADLSGTDLSGANLRSADLSGANLSGADLSGANLSGAGLRYANLSGTNLSGANLNDATLRDANLDCANLRDANLTCANLTRANLDGVNLDGANLEGAIGNLSRLKSISCDTYPVTYTADVMQIGCQRYKIEHWWGFDDAYIFEMDGEKALNWWRIWKPILQQIIATSPAIKQEE